jgi:hypothetical protein
MKTEHMASCSAINVLKTEIPPLIQDRKSPYTKKRRLRRNECNENENCNVQKRRKSMRWAVLNKDADSSHKLSEKKDLTSNRVDKVESVVQCDPTTDDTADVAGKNCQVM